MEDLKIKNCPLTLLFIFYLLVFSFLAGCGRKGDPVAIIPPQEKAVKNGSGVDFRTVQPTPPSGLNAVYTESSVVLTWDKVVGEDVKTYRLYRSSGNEYTLIGEAVIPAYTDRNIKQGIKYRYRVSSVSVSEGPLSEEIEVLTRTPQ